MRGVDASTIFFLDDTFERLAAPTTSKIPPEVKLASGEKHIESPFEDNTRLLSLSNLRHKRAKIGRWH